MSWKPGQVPNTGERLLEVKFRTGRISRDYFTAAKWRWTDTGDDHDIIAVRLAK